MSEYDELLEMKPACECDSCQMGSTEMVRAENPIHLLTNPPGGRAGALKGAAIAGAVGLGSAAADIGAQSLLPNKPVVPWLMTAAKIAGAFAANHFNANRAVSDALVSAALYQATWVGAAMASAPPQPEPAPAEVAPPAATPPTDPTTEGYHYHPDEEVTYRPNGDSYRRMPQHETGYWHTQTDIYGRPVELYHPGY